MLLFYSEQHIAPINRSFCGALRSTYTIKWAHFWSFKYIACPMSWQYRPDNNGQTTMVWWQWFDEKDHSLMTMAWQCNGMTTMVWWPWPIRWCWLAQKWWPDSNGTMKTTRWRWLDYNGLLMTAWWQKPDNCGWPYNKGQMVTTNLSTTA